MTRMILKATAPIVLAVLGGCIFAPAPRRVVVIDESPAPTTVVWEDEEVHTVVYREYFGATDEEILLIPHYRRYYFMTDEDIYFLFFTARVLSIPFDVCWRHYYYDCGRDPGRLVLYYRLSPSVYFVPFRERYSYPPVYARTYACYQSNTYNLTFTREEYWALVSMKVAVDYQGHTPQGYLARVQRGTPPSRIVIDSRADCGKGGRSATGGVVKVVAPRPWTMPAHQRQQWQKDHEANLSRSESSFKRDHPDHAEKARPPEHRESPDKPHDSHQKERQADNPPPKDDGKHRADDRPRNDDRPKEREHGRSDDRGKGREQGGKEQDKAQGKQQSPRHDKDQGKHDQKGNDKDDDKGKGKGKDREK